MANRAKNEKTRQKKTPDRQPPETRQKTAGKAPGKTPRDKQSALKKTKPKKKPHETRPTAREAVEIEARRYLVWDLYKAGASYRQISEHLKSKQIKGASIGSVFADLQYCLALQHDDLELSVREHIENEIAVINDVQFNFYPLMQNSKFEFDLRAEAAGVVLSCVKERAKLRNLYKAKEVKLNVDDELARLLGLNPEELPETDVIET